MSSLRRRVRTVAPMINRRFGFSSLFAHLYPLRFRNFREGAISDEREDERRSSRFVRNANFSELVSPTHGRYQKISQKIN